MLLPAAEAEALVEPFRRFGDWSSAHGIPAHMAIAGPWLLSVSLPIEALSNLASAIRGARYTLGTVRTLGDAICCFPQTTRWLSVGGRTSSMQSALQMKSMSNGASI